MIPENTHHRSGVSLELLVPTYNRRRVLMKNLDIIARVLRTLGKNSDVRVILVDNASTDDTWGQVSDWAEKHEDINIVAIRNDENVGLEGNILKALGLATASHVMFLGDDDFIPITYWETVLELLGEYRSFETPGVIIPSRRVLSDTQDVGEYCLAAQNAHTKKYRSGWRTGFLAAAACNQLSGLVFRREGLIEKWEEVRGRSLYPFMTFAGWAANRHDVYFVSGGAVLITEGASKDWGYGEDGLLSDILKNARFIASDSLLKRAFGELYLLRKWHGRIAMYWVLGVPQGRRCTALLAADDNLLLSTRFMIRVVSLYDRIRIAILRRMGRLGSPHLRSG